MATKMFKGKESMKEEMAEAKAIKSGKVSPKQYAMSEKREPLKMSNGGMVKGYANGGLVTGMAPNAPCGTHGPGVRSQQNYRK